MTLLSWMLRIAFQNIERFTITDYLVQITRGMGFLIFQIFSVLKIIITLRCILEHISRDIFHIIAGNLIASVSANRKINGNLQYLSDDA